MANANGLASKNIKFEVKGTGSSYTEMLGLYEIPALGSAPEKISVTNLSSATQIYVNGLQDPGDCEFSFWYMPADPAVANSKSNLEEWKLLEDGAVHEFRITFPDEKTAGTGTHHGTQCSFKGLVSAYTDSVGVNAAIPFKVSLALQDIYDGTTYTAHETFHWVPAT